MEKQEKEESQALKLVRHVWECRKRESKSWLSLNQAMYQAVLLAVQGGLEFSLEDFATMAKDFRGGYWMGHSTGAGDAGERFYCAAVEASNRSACLSFESWKGRKPFVLDTGARVAVGSEVDWEGQRAHLTSFREDSIVLCTYKADKEDVPVECPTCKQSNHRGDKLHQRFTVSHEDWVREMKRRKQARTPPQAGTLVEDFKGVKWVVAASTRRSEGEVELETVKRDGESLRTAKTYLTLRYPEFLTRGFKVAQPPMALVEGTLLEKDGEDWKVTWLDKRGTFGVQTVARSGDERYPDFPKESHGNLSHGALLAMGFKVKPSEKKGKAAKSPA